MHFKNCKQSGPISENKKKRYKNIANCRRAKNISWKRSRGLAAAALYVACVTNGENKTQRDVAEVTIRNRYKGLKVALNL
jgi:transcription initiation factor TFIIB